VDKRIETVAVRWRHTEAGAERVNRVTLTEGYTLEDPERSIPRILAIAHLRGLDAAPEVIVLSVTPEA
jgi:hypothetical protein